MRLTALLLSAFLLVPLAAPRDASAQLSADKPVRIVTGFPPGGPTDQMARAIGAKLQTLWKQNIVVETRPGASGAIAMQQLKASPPDGHFVIVAPSNTLAVTPFMMSNVGYDPLADFSYLWLVATIDNVLLVNAALPAANLTELVAHARRNPGQVSFGSPANGSQAHLSGELMNAHFGVRMVHVPYKGTGPALTDLLGGHIQMMFTPVAQALPQMGGGKLRAIGVPARARNAAMPEVPTFAELGVADFEAATWFMLIGPAGLSAATLSVWRDAMATMWRDPEMRERIARTGADLSSLPPAELSGFVRGEAARWRKVVQTAGIKAE